MVKTEIDVSDKPFLVWNRGNFRRENRSFRHQVDSKFPQNHHGDPKKSDGDDAIGRERAPEAPAIAEHPWQDQKHREGG